VTRTDPRLNAVFQRHTWLSLINKRPGVAQSAGRLVLHGITTHKDLDLKLFTIFKTCYY